MDTVKKDQGARDQVALLSFVDGLIKDKNDPNTNSENLPKVREVLLKQLNDDINNHLVSLLSEKDQLGLDELLDKNATDEEINIFFTDKIPNLEPEIASVLLEFRTAYLLPNEPVQTGSNSQPPPPPAPAPKMN